MQEITIQYHYKAETVSRTITIEVEDEYDRENLPFILEDWLEEAEGLSIDSPDGDINGYDLAYGGIDIEKVDGK